MKIHEYNEMMAYLTRPGMNTGGKVIGKPGGLVEPGVKYYGKLVNEPPSSKNVGNTSPVKTKTHIYPRKNRFRTVWSDTPHGGAEGWEKLRTPRDQGIQIRLIEDLQSGTVDINELAKKYEIPVEELKKHAKQLERNVWKKRAGTSPLKWLPNDDNILSPLLKKLYKSKLVVYQKDKTQELFFEAFGNPKNKKTYNLPKYKAMKKNWSEYNELRNSIKKIFPEIKFQLDHPLSKDTLRTIFKASSDQLTRVNPMIAELNNGFKKSLSTQYQKNLKNLPAKKAIEKIARDLGINIGRVSDDIKKYNFKVNQFQNLNMGDELVRAVEQQANLAKNLPNYVKNNAELFKTAGIDTKTIKPVTSINSSVINKIKTLIGNADIGIQSTDTQKTILSKINKAPIPKKAKVALLGVVGGVAAITGADLITSDLQAAETGTAAEEKDTGIPYEAGAAAATALGTYGPQIWKGAKAVGKTVTKPIMSPLAGGTFAINELVEDTWPIKFAEEGEKNLLGLTYDEKFGTLNKDASFSIAGLEMLWPDIMKRLGSKVSTAKKFYDTVLRMGVAPRLVPYLIRGMTGAGLVMIAGDVAHKVATESQPGMLIDKETGEPKAFDREKASFVMPTMIDAYEQASKYAQENKIPYEEAFKTLFGDKTFREGIDETIKKQGAFNQGGRVGYAKGPKDPKRRLVLKGLSALAVLPIVGRFFKAGKFLERGSTYMGPVIEKVKGMPDWFPGLVKKLWNEGEDVTKTAATMERQVVKRGTLEGGDDIDLVYDLDTGDVNIEVAGKKNKSGYYSGETSSGAYNKEYALEYKKGEVLEETGKKVPDEFNVGEIEGRMDQAAMDIDWDINTTTVDDAMSDLTELEAFAKSKSTKQIHKKKGTTKKDVFPDYDYSLDDYDID